MTNPPQDPGLCDIIKDQMEATTNQITYEALVWAYDKAMTFEHEAATLRLRLATAEAALKNVIGRANYHIKEGCRCFDCEKWQAVLDIADAAMKPDDQQEPAPVGGGGGDGVTVRKCPVSISECYYDCPIGTCRQMERETARGQEEGGGS